jgi:hypothetical protein
MEKEKMRIASKTPMLALVAALVVLATPGHAQLGFLVINEVDCDTPVTMTGNDEQEFIELYDGGVGNQSLVGYCLVFYNGSNDASYFAMDLTGTTDVNGYYLVGTPLVVPTPAQTWPVTANGTLQNGPDAVALYFGAAASFPLNTPILLGPTLIDAVVTETSDADDIGLLVLTPGQPQVDENFNSLSASESVFRCPNGSGGAFITVGWIAGAPTPASANVCPALYTINVTQVGGCGAPITFAVANAPAFAEMYNIISLSCTIPGSGPLFGVSVGPGSGDPLQQFFYPLGSPPFHVNADGTGAYSISFPTNPCPGVLTVSVQAVSISVSGGVIVLAVSQPMTCSTVTI